MEGKKLKIARVVTVPFALLGSRNVLEAMSNDFDLEVICSKGDYQEEIQEVLQKKIINIDIPRNIHIVRDIKAVLKLAKLFHSKKYTITHSNTPKGGLICSLSSFLVRVPIRCHTFTGQRWATLTGVNRWLLMTADKVVCKLNTNLYADSLSQIEFLEKNKIVSEGKVKCLGMGGFSGIDLSRFSRQKLLNNKKPIWLEKCDNSFVVGYVGRIARDKGIELLLASIKSLTESGFAITLVIIGPQENDLDPIDEEWLKFLDANKNIIRTGFMSNPEEALVHCHLLCLPSYREGFPMVVLEAAALEIPAVVSKIPGNIDTLIEGETGLFFPLEKPSELTKLISDLYNDQKKCLELGRNARKRVENHFSDIYIQNEFRNEYLLLNENYEKNL